MANQTDCAHYCVLTWLLDSFVLFGIAFYIPMLVMLIKNKRQFSTPFYSLFVSAGVADCWFALHKYLFYTLPYYLPLEVQRSIPMATMAQMGNWYLYYSQVLGVLMISINRFTAIVTPINHNRFWRPSNLFFVLSLQWALPLGWVVPMFFRIGWSRYYIVHGRAIADFLHRDIIFDTYWWTTTLLQTCIILPLFIILYIVIIYTHYKQQRRWRVQMNRNRVRRSSEIQLSQDIRLALNGLVVSTLYAAMCLVTFHQWLLRVVFSSTLDLEMRTFVSMLWLYINGFFTVSNPFLLFLLSEKVRKHLVAFLCCRRQ